MEESHSNETEGRVAIRLESTSVNVQWLTGGLAGTQVVESVRKLADVRCLFADRNALQLMDPEQEIYRVRMWKPVQAGAEGGLFWGVTILRPGRVGDEYFMTHGHIHKNRTRAEYYCCVSGKGMLVHMDQQRSTWIESMEAPTLHYIHGEHAHRVVNVGTEPLIFWACWGSDAGYDYGTIRERGFGARVVEREGAPVIVGCE